MLHENASRNTLQEFSQEIHYRSSDKNIEERILAKQYAAIIGQIKLINLMCT